jgi:hypothetical protein
MNWINASFYRMQLQHQEASKESPCRLTVVDLGRKRRWIEDDRIVGRSQGAGLMGGGVRSGTSKQKAENPWWIRLGSMVRLEDLTGRQRIQERKKSEAQIGRRRWRRMERVRGNVTG